MTHDDLLKQFNIKNSTMDGGHYIAKALRAVVELHKPTEEGMCDCGSGDPYLDYEYPCPTIQAIEKELK